MSATPISNVSDTALWVAHYRALESERPDAHFRDPFARRLAGERGGRMVATMRGGRGIAWAITVRTVGIDELIVRCVEREGVDTVLNLAAGLDTRPYRMSLPPALRWIEVDLPDLLDYKESFLAGETPVCDLERVRLDLRDRPARQALFARLGAAGRKVLAVSEGLLLYLGEDEVASLARDLHVPASFAFWIHDLASPWLLRRMRKQWAGQIENAPFRFGPAAGVDFFRPHGWVPEEERFTWEEGRRLRREMRLAPLWRFLARLAPKARQEEIRRVSSVVLERRAEAAV